MRGVANSRLWGNSKSLQVTPTLGPTRIFWGEVARIEAELPTTWNVFGRLSNNGGNGTPFDPADLAAMSFVWELVCGTGMIQVPLVFAVAGVGSPNVPQLDATFYFQAMGLPAQWITARLEAFGAVAVGGLWTVDTWATPLAGSFEEK
jgi:hypothetical protein